MTLLALTFHVRTSLYLIMILHRNYLNMPVLDKSADVIAWSSASSYRLSFPMHFRHDDVTKNRGFEMSESGRKTMKRIDEQARMKRTDEC